MSRVFVSVYRANSSPRSQVEHGREDEALSHAEQGATGDEEPVIPVSAESTSQLMSAKKTRRVALLH
jgi:hypothetical protein